MIPVIVPAVIPHKKELALRQIREISGFSQHLQLDITDGIFTQKKTLQAEDFSKNDFSGIALEVHLMHTDPEKVVPEWIHLGAQRIVIHAEASPSAQLLQLVEQQGVIAVIGCCAPTPIDRLEPYTHIANSFLFLTIDPPGSQGLALLDGALQKMKKFHERYPAYSLTADGGANQQTIESIRSAGATRIIAGSSLQEGGHFFREKFTNLQKLVSE